MRFIAIYGKNSEEWLLSDLAANLYGITSVSIYDTLGADSMRFILNQTNLTTIFCSVPMIINILKEEKFEKVENIVYFEL